MAETWSRLLTRWTEAGLLDAEAAARIRDFELAHADSNRLRWPIRLALTFGALTLGAGILLFVSAHWDNISPPARFSLVMAMVAVFHVAGAMVAEQFPLMGSTLHALGTLALGAGIFLAGQIFNLDEHWPGGVMLWTLGAAAAWALLQDWRHTILVALLAPSWLLGEWIVAVEPMQSALGWHVASCGSFLLALAYFTTSGSDTARGSEIARASRTADRFNQSRLALVYIGGVMLIPAAIDLAFSTDARIFGLFPQQSPSTTLRIVGWTAATGIPLAVAIVARRAAAWPNALAALWVLFLFRLRPIAGDLAPYIWWATSAAALAAWGVAESRSERINLGTAIFTGTVLVFYFSEVMDKLGRSASLVGLGLLFLAGGWAIEKIRRRLIWQAQGGLV